MANQYTVNFPKNFWDRVNRSGPLVLDTRCWDWTGKKDDCGYGWFSKYGTSRAHRVSYIMHYGTFNLRLKILHKCDRPSCVNPDHLIVGSHKDNMIDMSIKGRERNGASYSNESYEIWLSTRPNKTIDDCCRKGHTFSIENTKIKKDRDSWKRVCRLCEYQTATRDPVLSKVKNFVRGVGDDRAAIVEGLYQKVKEYEEKCAICLDKDFECFDHILPKSLGGVISVENINPACNDCNFKKGNRL